jgi:hypothetical protein
MMLVVVTAAIEAALKVVIATSIIRRRSTDVAEEPAHLRFLPTTYTTMSFG